ncbi:dephospho-CoA kinase [Candidatus Aquiluna sp. UB-MaderosW2red]|uniref:dephospho-CoA kinase n=1 Tax=Candidatus Aquiluna sp. UB-MaderosW2red TaxID=1855377 RepID=UPI000875BA56|nr:dephospho-CoA kinase [Candidatus Aquiluna sp. UB-MaderosW2red]SCX11908.1 dephospho-CoA kinase [Candidatus Aquiluna sp. UB-MaderosW2red]
MLIGLTGGIGSGKSTVARRWVELGATEIDADLLAREAVEPESEGLTLLVEEFGAGILQPTGELDRGLLAALIFGDEVARLKVEAILHPLIQELAAKRVAATSGVIIYSIPLMVETQSKLRFDKIVAISCSEKTRITRLIKTRAMTVEQARLRVDAQASDAEREAIADFVINSDCSLPELISRADVIYASLSA